MTLSAILCAQFNHSKSYYALHSVDSAANGVPVWIYLAFVVFVSYIGFRVYFDIKRDQKDKL